MHGHQIRQLVSALSFATFLIAVLALPASATAPRVVGAIPAPHAGPVTAVAKITGSGTAQMGASFFGSFYGTTLWWENQRGITLYSDGSAKGTFYCVDLPDSTGHRLGCSHQLDPGRRLDQPTCPCLVRPQLVGALALGSPPQISANSSLGRRHVEDPDPALRGRGGGSLDAGRP
jgi:hypothetical protein